MIAIYKHSLKSLLAAAALAVATSASAEIAVIANPGAGISAASAEEIQRFYLGKSKNLAGAKLTAVDQTEGSASREEFYDKVVKKNANQLRAYWSKLVFTGKGKPPKEIGGDAEVLAKVASDPSAVGYVAADKVDGSVVVLHREP